jgi:histidyl-tRNA synthetase
MNKIEEIQKPRGTQDIFFENYQKFEKIINSASSIAKLHNFNTIRTPTFESVELFERNIGETSDAVAKELYRFEDAGSRQLALRPEFTASVVRAFLENNALNQFPAPLRLFSWGQIFRYDRPKKGRYREFHQINFECFNEKDDAIAFFIASEILRDLKILHKTKLIINFLGDAKLPYTKALKEYFSNNFENLSDISKIRIEKNPLRILDSKEKQDIALLQNAPKISDFHSENDKKAIANIKNFLSKYNDIQFEIDENLVRGLDYYTGVVFEFIAPIAEDGSNLAILGGGRYDNLISQMGGKQTNAIGFGGGIERIALLLELENLQEIFFILTTIENFDYIDFIKKLKLQFQNTSFQNIQIEKNKIGKTLQKLSEIQNSFAIVIGEKEISQGKAIIKNLTQNSEVCAINL